MKTNRVEWVVVADSPENKLINVAESTWRSVVTNGGSPPAWDCKPLSDHLTALIGYEPGLQGCFDLWAEALSKPLDTLVTVIDLNPEFLQVFEGKDGRVIERSDLNAIELAIRFGVLPKPVETNKRDLLIIEDGSDQALLQMLSLNEMPPALRTRMVTAGLAVWTVAEKGSISVILHKASFIGPCYLLMWGPPPREFACATAFNGETTGWFDTLNDYPNGVPQLETILNETVPKLICNKLGINDFLMGFPSD